MDERKKKTATDQACRQREQKSRQRQLGSFLLSARGYDTKLVAQRNSHHREIEEAHKQRVLAETDGEIQAREHRGQQHIEPLGQGSASAEDRHIAGETPVAEALERQEPLDRAGWSPLFR